MFSRHRDGRDPFVVVVRDADGRVVERVDTEDAGVADLYRSARRQALRADLVIDALLRELG